MTAIPPSDHGRGARRFAVGSLRGRLLLGAVAMSLVFAAIFAVIAEWEVGRAEDQAIDAALHARLALAREQLRPDGSLIGLPTPKNDLVQVVGADGTVRAATPALRGFSPLVLPAQVTRSDQPVRGTVTLSVPDVDLAYLAVGSAPPNAGGALVVAVDTEGFTTATDGLTTVLIGGLTGVVVLMAALSWVVSGRALRNVHRLTAQAEHVRSADLRDGLPVPAADAELSRLVEALNRMLARVHDSHTTELTFAAEAGHRLRTPLATLRTEAELALLDPRADSRTQALRQIIADVDQLTSIVDRMLARTRSRRWEPDHGLWTQACDRWCRQARTAGTGLDLDISTDALSATDLDDLLRIVDPIIDNALRHTPTGGRIAVTRTDLSNGWLEVRVANDGRPVPAELRPHLFDAWISSRPASAAGGLGLWLSREIARDLGGDVVLSDTDTGRTCFMIRVPLRSVVQFGPGRAVVVTASGSTSPAVSSTG